MKIFPRLAAAALLLLSAAVPYASAQTAFPNKPIRIIVPLGPGSGLDATTRLLAVELSKQLGTPVYVENKPGADGGIAARDLVTAPADGHTVMAMAASHLAVNPVLSDKLTYDPQDIRPLASITRGGALIVTAANSRFKSLGELLAAARQNPGTVTFATYSPSYRLGMLRFQKTAGVQFNEVPYKSPGDALNNVLGGQVDATIMEYGSGIDLLQGGRARALAVTHASRHPKLPQVPTVVEQGVPGFTFYSWLGFGVHAKTPQPAFDRLQEAILQIGKSKEFLEYLERRGNDSYLLTGSQLAAAIKTDLDINRELVKQVTK